MRNTLSNAVGRVVALGLSFVLTPFILQSLGPTAFGLWVLAQIVVGYGVLLDLGIGAALVRQVADVQTRDQPDEAALVAGTSTRTFVALAGVALLLGSGVSVAAPKVLGSDVLEDSTVTWVFMLVTLGFAVNLAGTPAIASLRGLQRYDLSNAVTVVSALVSAALVVVVLLAGGGVVALVAINVPMALATQLAAVLMLRRENARHALRWSPASAAVARSMTRSGSSIIVSQVADLLQKRTSELIVAASLGAVAVTPFSLARRLSEVPHQLSDQFIKVLLPVASELNATGSHKDLRRLYLASTRVTLALMLPLGLVTAFLSADLLELWVGDAYRDQAPVVVLLVVASIASTSQWPAGAVFQGMGRFGPFAVGALTSGAVSVGLGILLVGPYGLQGVAVATLIPTVLEALFFVGPFAVRRLGVSVGSLLTVGLLPAIAPGVPCVLVLFALTAGLDTSGWPGLLVTSGAAVSVYVVTYLLMPATGLERRALTQWIRRGPAGR